MTINISYIFEERNVSLKRPHYVYRLNKNTFLSNSYMASSIKRFANEADLHHVKSISTYHITFSPLY